MESREYVDMLYGLHKVADANNWGQQLGLSYEHKFAAATAPTGWTLTGTAALVAPSGADFGSLADRGVTGGISLDTAGDALDSPAIFGSYDHMRQVGELINTRDLPTRLVLDLWARFGANADESASGMGFVEDGGTGAVAADHLAAFAVVAGNFVLHSDAESIILAAADLLPHHWRIVVDRIANNAIAYIDDMATKKGTSIAIKADEWPARFGAGVLTGTGTNDPVLDAVRIRYGFGGWL